MQKRPYMLPLLPFFKYRTMCIHSYTTRLIYLKIQIANLQKNIPGKTTLRIHVLPSHFQKSFTIFRFLSIHPNKTHALYPPLSFQSLRLSLTSHVQFLIHSPRVKFKNPRRMPIQRPFSFSWHLTHETPHCPLFFSVTHLCYNLLSYSQHPTTLVTIHALLLTLTHSHPT